jgi:GTP-binding protein Era
MTTSAEDKRCGFAAIIGAPNAGKSTLVNKLVGAKVSIVTHKVQTTRFNVRGVLVEGQSQIVLVDTPGIFNPKRALDRAMVQAAWNGAAEADKIVHLVDAPAYARVLNGKDAKGQDQLAFKDVDRIIEGLKTHELKADLALNKIDLLDKEDLLKLAKHFEETGRYNETFMISASKGLGLKALKATLATAMPEGPWHYPEDQIADLPSRLLAAEVTREKLMLRVHEELPYAASVETETWEEHRNGAVRIGQVIYVQRESQRKIVLGKGGQVIKAIGATSRQELSHMFDRKVHLFLHVKVRENWANDRSHLALFGLELD